MRQVSRAPQIPAWNPSRWRAWVGIPSMLTLVLLLILYAIDRQQHEIFIRLNRSAAHWPAEFWSACSMLGDTTVLLALLAPLLIRHPRLWMAALAAVPLGGLYSAVTKHLAAVPRPAAVLDPAQFHLIGPALHHHSFPSGHSITAFAAAAAILAAAVPPIWHWRHRLLIAVALTLAIAVSFSRIAVGAHWPADLLAGAVGGWIAGLSGAFLTRHWRTWWTSRRLHCAAAIGLAATVGWMSLSPATYPLGMPVLWLAAASSALTAVWLLGGWARAGPIGQSITGT